MSVCMGEGSLRWGDVALRLRETDIVTVRGRSVQPSNRIFVSGVRRCCSILTQKFPETAVDQDKWTNLPTEILINM